MRRSAEASSLVLSMMQTNSEIPIRANIWRETRGWTNRIMSLTSYVGVQLCDALGCDFASQRPDGTLTEKQ